MPRTLRAGLASSRAQTQSSSRSRRSTTLRQCLEFCSSSLSPLVHTLEKAVTRFVELLADFDEFGVSNLDAVDFGHRREAVSERHQHGADADQDLLGPRDVAAG